MAFVAVTTGVSASGTSTTDSGITVAVGDTVVTETRVGGTTCATVTDSLGNTYTKKVSRVNSTTDEHALFVANITAAGTPTITITPTASGTIRSASYQFSGRDTTNPVGSDTASAGGTSTTPSLSLSVSTASSDVIGCSDANNTVTFTAGTGYTLRREVPAAPAARIGGETADAVSSGTLTVDCTISGSTEWNMVALALKPAAGGTVGRLVGGALCGGVLVGGLLVGI